MYVRPRPRFRPRNAGGVPFSPALLFTSGVAGAWYDPSDTSTLFQDSAGTTPVTAVEQPVGLMLDKSQGLSGSGSQLVTNGDFSSPSTTGWQASAGGSFSVVSNRLQVTGAAAVGSGAAYTLTTVVGMTYTVSFDVVLGTAAVVDSQMSLSVAAGSSIGTSYQYCNVNGTYKYSFVATATTTYFQFHPRGTGNTASVDNFSVISLGIGNHASQATAASRPILRARYNQLTYSEQFDNAAWSKTQLNTTGTPAWINQAVAPDATTTADKLIPTAVSGQHYIAQQATLSTTPCTFTVYAKSAEYGYCVLMFYGASATVSDKYTVFNLADGTATQTASGVTASAASVGNGWFRLSITFTMLASGTVTQYVLASNASTYAGATFTGDGTSGIYIWGADLRTGSSAGTYQRIAAATDYATAGFLPYLYFVTDDSFGTNSIDFTATDKMSVCAGVTKLSDAATAVIVEASAIFSSNNGSFALFAPPAAANTAATYYSRGTINVSAQGAFGASPATAVLSGLSDINADICTVRVNTAATTVSTDQGTGNYGNYPLYIGRRNNASLPFTGNIYQLVVVGKTLSASELASTEAYVNQKTGAF